MDTHWTVDRGARKSRANVGMATLTIVVSRIDMMLPSTTTSASRFNCGSNPASPPPAPPPAGGASGVVSAVSGVVTVVLVVAGGAPSTVRRHARP